MLDFPSAGLIANQTTFTAPNGAVWLWDGGKWVPAVNPSAPVYIQDAPTDGVSYIRQDGLWVPEPGFNLGYVNKLRNGTFDVWQRGVTGLANGGYTADGWVVNFAGGAPTSQRVTNNRPNALSQYGLQVNGVAGVTGGNIIQRIESGAASPFNGWPITFQSQLYNGTAGSVTPTITVLHPTVQDNWNTTATDLGPVALQTVNSGTWGQLGYTFTAPYASLALGLGISIGFPALLAGNSITLTEADLRCTPGWPTGQTGILPIPELRPLAAEILFCQRYFRKIGGSGVAYDFMLQGYMTAGSGVSATFPLTPPMRANPTATNVGPLSLSNCGTPTMYAGVNSMSIQAVATAAGQVVVYSNNTSQYITLSAEL